MGRYFRYLTAALLVSFSTLLSACNSIPTSMGSADGYAPRDSMNPACSDGFRPSNGRSCGY
jgi:starvation-inducible outer membrane lipoprotein